MASAWTFGGRLRVNWDRAEWEVKSEECGRREDDCNNILLVAALLISLEPELIMVCGCGGNPNEGKKESR